MLLHTALISTILMKSHFSFDYDESKDKRKEYSRSVHSERWKIHYLTKLPLVSFVFGF